eukprot:snap_masked-scaffold_75-processed-gene-0.40-mRNA-1 protein AED:1.00 eAED:1.00 QI:0/-1/0/0/-1/1/1/0/76
MYTKDYLLQLRELKQTVNDFENKLTNSRNNDSINLSEIFEKVDTLCDSLKVNAEKVVNTQVAIQYLHKNKKKLSDI